MTSEIPWAEGQARRQQHLARTRRVVLKVGSAVLTAADGINLAVLENLGAEIAHLRASGREVLLVSSGAVASGRKRLGLGSRPLLIMEKQAAAAVGQSCLMHAYEDVFGRFGLTVGQILLTHDDLSHRHRFLNIRNTIFTLLRWGIVPIINENDSVSVQELRFGDNDTLAAMLTNLIEADFMACLTDVDGLYTGNPSQDPTARRVLTVAAADRRVEAMAGHVSGLLGTGGMRSKILAARMVSARGGASFIGPGREPGVIRRLFAGEAVGTFFLPQATRLAGRKHWIAFVLRPKGALVLDAGARQALVGGGRSLLPSGIREVLGRFGVGAPVQCLDEAGTAFAIGLVNYTSSDISRILGQHSSRIEEILGFTYSDEVIHRDNLVLLPGKEMKSHEHS
ncbi:MAG: glutamate 5-kinase [Thermodesulfobacteriota bacterium]